MCEAATIIGISGLVLGAVGTGIQVSSQIQEGNAAKEEADRNAKLANDAARYSVAQGEKDAATVRGEGAQVAAAQKTAYAAAGVDPSVGTPAQMQSGAIVSAEMDAQTIRAEAAREAWGFKSTGLDYQRRGAMDQRRSRLNAAGTLITGGARVGSDLYSFLKTKPG